MWSGASTPHFPRAPPGDASSCQVTNNLADSQDPLPGHMSLDSQTEVWKTRCRMAWEAESALTHQLRKLEHELNEAKLQAQRKASGQATMWDTASAQMMKVLEAKVEESESKCNDAQTEARDSAEKLRHAKVKALSVCGGLEWQSRRIKELTDQLQKSQGDRQDGRGCQECEELEKAKREAVAHSASLEQKLLSLSATCTASILQHDLGSSDSQLFTEKLNRNASCGIVSSLLNNEAFRDEVLAVLKRFHDSRTTQNANEERASADLQRLLAERKVQTEQILAFQVEKHESFHHQQLLEEELRSEIRSAKIQITQKEAQLRSEEGIIDRLLHHAENQEFTLESREQDFLKEAASCRKREANSEVREKRLLEEIAASAHRQQQLLTSEQQLFNEAAAQDIHKSELQEMQRLSPRVHSLPRSPEACSTLACFTIAPRTPPRADAGPARSDLNWGRVAEMCSAEKSIPGISPGLNFSPESQANSQAATSELEPVTVDELRNNDSQISFEDPQVLLARKDQLIAVLRHHEKTQTLEIHSLRNEVAQSEQEMEQTRESLASAFDDLKAMRLQERFRSTTVQEAASRDASLVARLRVQSEKQQTRFRKDVAIRDKELEKVKKQASTLEVEVHEKNAELRAFKYENATFLETLRHLQDDCASQKEEIHNLRSIKMTQESTETLFPMVPAGRQQSPAHANERMKPSSASSSEDPLRLSNQYRSHIVLAPRTLSKSPRKAATPRTGSRSSSVEKNRTSGGGGARSRTSSTDSVSSRRGGSLSSRRRVFPTGLARDATPSARPMGRERTPSSSTSSQNWSPCFGTRGRSALSAKEEFRPVSPLPKELAISEPRPTSPRLRQPPEVQKALQSASSAIQNISAALQNVVKEPSRSGSPPRSPNVVNVSSANRLQKVLKDPTRGYASTSSDSTCRITPKQQLSEKILDLALAAIPRSCPDDPTGVSPRGEGVAVPPVSHGDRVTIPCGIVERSRKQFESVDPSCAGNPYGVDQSHTNQFHTNSRSNPVSPRTTCNGASPRTSSNPVMQQRQQPVQDTYLPSGVLLWTPRRLGLGGA